jgi:hypothetical protein
MTIYYIDIDVECIVKKYFDNIFNLEQFYRELDELYVNGWYESEDEAEESLKEILL